MKLLCSCSLFERSHIYQARRKIAKMYIKHIPPKFDWFLSLKTYHYQSPIFSMSAVTIAVVFLFGHIIYIFERYGKLLLLLDLTDYCRENEISRFDYGTSLYVSITIYCRASSLYHQHLRLS